MTLDTKADGGWTYVVTTEVRDGEPHTTYRALGPLRDSALDAKADADAVSCPSVVEERLHSLCQAVECWLADITAWRRRLADQVEDADAGRAAAPVEIATTGDDDEPVGYHEPAVDAGGPAPPAGSSTLVDESERSPESEEHVAWLRDFAFRLGTGAQLQLDGSIGFGRECVGIVVGGNYLEYDEAAVVRCPPGAYHKGNYLAVLGHGEDSIASLYLWCREWDAAGYKRADVGVNPDFVADRGGVSVLQAMLGQHQTYRLARAQDVAEDAR